MDHHGFLVGFLDSVWANENPEAALAFFAPGAQIDGLGSDESLTPQDLVTFAGAVLMLIEPPRWEVLRVVVDGDRASYLARAHAISRQTGAEVTLTGQVMLTLEDGLITEAFNNFDLIALFIALGRVPENFLEQALLGSLPA